MPTATNEQVQAWSSFRTRPSCELARHLLLSAEDDVAAIGDVYANLTDSPDWTDSQTGGPPSLLTPSDLLAVNTFMENLAAVMRGKDKNGTALDEAGKIAAVNAVSAQLPIVLKACVRPATQPSL